MLETIYYESTLSQTDQLKKLRDRFQNSAFIPCNHYGEIFNRKNQNFRLQKQSPALILSEKQGTFVHACPDGYGIGRENNYYFSHLLNCPYDCRYCYLQGFFNSAHFVFFINHQQFFNEIEALSKTLPEKSLTIFTGYDCDSLGLNNLTHFFQTYYPFFESLPNVDFELRTKSSSIAPLLKAKALPNIIPAYSLSPSKIQQAIEHKTASTRKRIQNLKKLQDQGYPIGLRIDPMIWTPDWKEVYNELFDSLENELNLESIHSVTIGAMRFPKHLYKVIQKLYPDDPLFHLPLSSNDAFFSYNKENIEQMTSYTSAFFSDRMSKGKVFICH